ncbi:Stretch-activated cation channel MID1 [Termitomyces sp. T112]|nr:Stretch-activated cation channel MID1 [Termitomyces sp. T112]
MLPETLWCLLGAALAAAQARQKLPLNSNSAFSPDNIPNPPAFTLPAAVNLTISVALCSTNSHPRFFVTNTSIVAVPGSEGGKDVFEIEYTDGLGSWTGNFVDGGVLAIEDSEQTSFEVGISDEDPIHSLLPNPDLPLLGDTTSDQAIIFSPVFSEVRYYVPTWPNYTFPPANLTQPPLPSGSPNYTLIISPTSSTPSLASLPQTGCMLLSRRSTGTISNESLWLRDAHGWRTQWLVEGLAPSANYTAYVIKDSTQVGGPIYFATKSASFTCPLVYGLPYCPDVAYPVPLPQPSTISGSRVYTAVNLPENITIPLLSYLTNFTVTLSTFACGRDMYSPIVTCVDCQRAYRKWLCSITFTRCGEPSLANPISFTSTAPDTRATGLSALQPKNHNDPTAPQKVFSALVAQSTDISKARSPTLPAMGSPYFMLLPCLETCNAVDRACPPFVGFTCPTSQFNAAASYGVGYIDGADGDEGQGATGGSQDRWGNIWCNGG